MKLFVKTSNDEWNEMGMLADSISDKRHAVHALIVRRFFCYSMYMVSLASATTLGISASNCLSHGNVAR